MIVPSLTKLQRSLSLGTSGRGESVRLLLKYLATHLHVLGPPGTGKSRLLLRIFQELCSVEVTIILFVVKGDLGTMARDWSITHGYTNRLIWFDPQDEQSVLGYNPLHPNHLQVATHAKNIREAVLSAWGQSGVDQTPQLSRFLVLVLFAVRELTLTLTEALDLLRPQSPTRRLLLPAISDPYVRAELAYLDGLRPDRQDQLLAPTLARLQPFVLDPVIRRMITQQTSPLTLADVVRQKQILILNFEQYRPLALDDIKLLTRFAINDIVAHVFSRPAGQRTPVSLLLDEAQNFITPDLCRALDQGREMGLHCVLAHQYLNQLREEEGTGLLADSVLKCARSRILFGGLATEDLKVLTPEVVIDDYDPWRVKDEITTLECEPVEVRREVVTEGDSKTENTSQTKTESQGQSESQTKGRASGRGRSVGSSQQVGVSHSRGETVSASEGTAVSEGDGRSSSSTLTTGESVLPGDAGAFGLGAPTLHSTGAGQASGASSFRSRTDIASHADGRTITRGQAQTKTQAQTKSHGRQQTQSETESVSESQTFGHQQGQSNAWTTGLSLGSSRTKSLTPWHEYRKRRIVSSRQFLNLEEQMTLWLQRIKALPIGHFLLKLPDQKAIFVRAPFVQDPWISAQRRQAALERIYQQSCYSTPEQIAAEEDRRAKQIEALQVQRKSSTMKRITHSHTKARGKTNRRKQQFSKLISPRPSGKK